MVLNLFPTPLKLISFIIILILQEFFKKIEYTSQLEIIDFIDEICVLIMSFFLLVYFLKKNEIQRLFVPLSFSYLIYVLFGVVSSVFGEVVFGQSIFQFVLDLKFFIVVAFCVASYRPKISEHYYEKFLYNFLFLNVPFVFWQLILTDSYNRFFSAGSHFGLVFLNDGSELLRAAGIFWFTGTLANYSALVFGYLCLKKYFGHTFNTKEKFVLATSLFIAISTLSKGETFAAIISIFATIMLLNRSFSIKVIYISLMSAIAVILIISFSEMFHLIIRELGFGPLGVEAAPRSIFMQASIDLANNNFPIGAGLGALGGQAAVSYDSHYFYHYLISHEWYFSERMFLTDTYWPKVFAETGFLSVLPLLYFIFLPAIFAIKAKNNLYVPIFVVIMCFIMSLSAPIYNSPLIMCFMYFTIGSACYTNARRTN